MSTKITQAQLEANTTTYALKDYREMVNYVSGTNKGYVRFTKADDGKLKLEKFNNKIDVPLSWRSNTSAAHNKAVREKFLNALEHDLKYMGDSANSIRKLVLTPKVPGKDVEDPGKALSRRDLKDIFEKFDAQFNTGSGRTAILKHFMAAAKLECGFDGTDEEFARDYLQAKEAGVDVRFTEYISKKTGEGVEALPQHQRMVKSEADFRQLLYRLEGLVDDAKQRLAVETALKSAATALAKNGGEFGVKLDPDTEDKVRGALTKLLQRAEVKDADFGFGSGNPALEMFIKNVVPVLVKEGAENLKDAAAAGDAAKEAVLDADFNIDRIFSLAREFIQGAKEAVEDTKDVPPQDNGDKFAAYIAGMKKTFDEQIKGLNQVAVFKEAREVFTLNMNGGKVVNPELAKQVAEMTPQFIKEAKLDLYTARFLKKHFAKSAASVVENEGNFMEKARGVIEKVKIAGQINFGERWQTNPGVTNLSDVRVAAGGNVQAFLSEMGKRVANIVNDKKGGLPLYEKLMSRTLTAILNQKIRNAAESGGVARIHIDVTAFDDVEKRIRRTVDAYCAFRDGKGAQILEKAEEAFRRQLDRLSRKGNLDPQGYNMLLADFRNRMKAAFENAAARFLDRAPRSADVDADETKKADLTFLANALNEEKSDVLADMRQRIATMVITRGFNPDVRRELLTDMDKRVAECAEKLKKDGVAPTFTTDDATMSEALTKLYYKTLADVCGNKAIAGKQMPANLVSTVKDAFYAAAKKLVAKANELATAIDREFKTMAGVAAEDLTGRLGFNAYKKDLPAKEYDAMQESLRADLTLALKGKMDALKRGYLLRPEAYSKKDVDDFKAVGDIFEHVGKDGVYTQESVTRIFRDITDARFAAVQAWIHNPTGPEGKGTLEGDMIVRETQRLAEPNAGKAGEYAAKLPKNERANIVAAAVKAVLASAEKYALSYATGGKKAFMERVSKEVQAIVDRHVEAHAKFREQFVKDAQPYLAKYVDALKTEKKDGIQVATDKMNAVLDEISRQKEPPSIKGFALAFDGMLQKLVQDKIDMKMDAFLAYSAKVTAAYENCVAAFNEEIAARRDDLKAAGATDDDLKFFDEKLAPAIRSDMDTVLQQNANLERLVENAPAYGRAAAGQYVKETTKAIVAADMSNAESLRTMLRDMHMSVLYREGETEKTTQEAVATWMKSPDVQKLARELRLAKMTLAAYGADSVSQAANDARAKVEEFKNALREAVMGLKAAVLEAAFDVKHVEPAVSLFKVWLKQYDLPQLTVKINGVGDMTLEAAAERHFTFRIAEMKQKIAENPSIREPLLSADYIRSFTRYLNNIGREAMFRALEERLVNARVNEMLAQQGNTDVYNFSSQYGDDATARVRRESTAQNMKDLVNTMVNILDRTRHVMKDMLVSLEDMKRWGEVIEREFTRMISGESERLAKFDAFARSRVALMTSIDLNNISGDVAVANYVKEALRTYLGVDIAEPGVLDAKFLKKNKIDLDGLVAYLNKLTRSAVDETVAQFKENAMRMVRPGDTLEPLPTGRALSAKFKDIAVATVRSVAETPDKKAEYASKEEASQSKAFAKAMKAIVAEVEKKKARMGVGKK